MTMTIIVNEYDHMTAKVIFRIFLIGQMTIQSTDDYQSHMRVKIGYDYGVTFIIDFMTATVMTVYDSIESTFSVTLMSYPRIASLCELENS